MIKDFVDKDRGIVVFGILCFFLMLGSRFYFCDVNQSVFDGYLLAGNWAEKEMFWFLFFPMAVSVILIPEQKRTIRHAVLSIAIGVGTFVLFEFRNVIGIWAFPIIAGAALFIGGNIVRYCRKYGRFPFHPSCIMIIRTMGLAFLIMLMVFSILFLSDGFKEKLLNDQKAMWQSKVQAEAFFGEEYSLTRNYDSISLIRDEAKWRKASKKEQEKTVQDIINCQGRFLGISHKMKLKVDKLRNSVIAQWDENDNVVKVNSLYWDAMKPKDLCESVMHECYHAYEYEIVRLYLSVDEKSRNLFVFEGADKYLHEMYVHYENCEEGMENFDNYYKQRTEEDAREYARLFVEKFYREMDEIEKNRKKKNSE